MDFFHAKAEGLKGSYLSQRRKGRKGFKRRAGKIKAIFPVTATPAA
jgi:hypothetical protein